MKGTETTFFCGIGVKWSPKRVGTIRWMLVGGKIPPTYFPYFLGVGRYEGSVGKI